MSSPSLLRAQIVEVIVLALASPVLVETQPMPNRPLALLGGTVLAGPMEDPITNGIVVIRDGEIDAVGPRESVRAPGGAATLDCSELTVTAGFWNSHVHFFERKWADAASIPAPELAGQIQAMLTRYGFTSVFDLGSPGENTRRLRDRIEAGEMPGPRIRSTGEGLLAKGWLPAAAPTSAA